MLIHDASGVAWTSPLASGSGTGYQNPTSDAADSLSEDA
jgi:hypothetical protein